MLLDIPFIPNEKYIDFLSQRLEHLHSCHFSLYSSDVQDARHRFDITTPETMIDGLKRLPGIRKYALINGRLHHPDTYFDPQVLSGAADMLDKLVRASVLDGIVFSDAYYLLALSDARPEVVEHLEAVPSLNCLIDSVDKLNAMLDLIESTKFRLPQKILLDRSLNRRPEELAAVVRSSKIRLPDSRIGLIANEGCLDQCPFKLAHDAHISMANACRTPIRTHEINRDYGCARVLGLNPEKILKSPFIRPEDMKHYEGFADFIKICGRTLGPNFLIKAVTAYIEEKFSGNLLDLMDACNWMAAHLYLDNDLLPDDFHHHLTACEKKCRTCDWCRKVFESIASRFEYQLTDIKSSI